MSNYLKKAKTLVQGSFRWHDYLDTFRGLKYFSGNQV